MLEASSTEESLQIANTKERIQDGNLMETWKGKPHPRIPNTLAPGWPCLGRVHKADPLIYLPITFL